MDFPKGFLEKYQEILGDKYEAFVESFEASPISAFRVNPLKNLPSFFKEEKIPHSHWGYYGKVSGKSPLHVAGLVYSQEPAAQMVGEIAQPAPNSRVLDLCAAPGGKSTHLVSFLGDTGLLVSNEISTKRCQPLVENIERFGARNTVILNESSAHLTQTFEAYFDLIVVDAPCSGEGMFRKDPEAMAYWNENYPASCAKLQKEILSEAVKMLKGGGQLVYATCTWSPEEDEENVRWLLNEFPTLELVYEQKYWPQDYKGEGQFVAKFQDKRENEKREQRQVKSGKSNLNAEQRQLWQEFSAQYLTHTLEGLYQVFGDALYLLPEGLPDLKNLKIARNGLHLGTFKKKRFEPSFALGLALKPTEVKYSLELTESQFDSYMAGETLSVAAPNGWVQVLIAGNGLTFAKVAAGILKNTIPKGLRFSK